MMQSLVEFATKAQENAFAPFSKFKVGAAVLCDDGTIVTGSNVEVACSSAGICAERIAVASAIHQGKFPTALAIVTDSEQPTSPCGVCRQFLIDFAPLSVIMATRSGNIRCTSIDKLLPNHYEGRKTRV